MGVNKNMMPPSKMDMGIKVPQDALSEVIIYKGTIDGKVLKKNDLSYEWIKGELNKSKIDNIDSIYLGGVLTPDKNYILFYRIGGDILYGCFGVIKDISLLGYVLRTLIVGIISFGVGRFMMKRTINQLTTYDFSVVWILGAITVAPLLDGEISFTYIIVPLIALFFLALYYECFISEK